MLLYLYKILYFKFPNFIMQEFISKEKMNSLSIICKSGHYKNRIFIVENLSLISKPNRLQLILILINDKIESISQKAIKSSNDIKLNTKLQKVVDTKVKHWENRKLEREQNEKRTKRLLKNSKNKKRKFSKGESYQNMKEMLKKPMNTGKWF